MQKSLFGKEKLMIHNPFVLIVGVGEGGMGVGVGVTTGTGEGVRGKTSLCCVLCSFFLKQSYTTAQLVPRLLGLLPFMLTCTWLSVSMEILVSSITSFHCSYKNNFAGVSDNVVSVGSPYLLTSSSCIDKCTFFIDDMALELSVGSSYSTQILSNSTMNEQIPKSIQTFL